MRACDYNRAISEEICERVSTGETLAEVLRSDKRFPPRATWWHWCIDKRDALDERYRVARQGQAEAWADRIVEVASKCREGEVTTEGPKGTEVRTGDMVDARRLEVDALKWIMGRTHAGQYGDKVKTEITGEGGGPVVLSWRSRSTTHLGTKP